MNRDAKTLTLARVFFESKMTDGISSGRGPDPTTTKAPRIRYGTAVFYGDGLLVVEHWGCFVHPSTHEPLDDTDGAPDIVGQLRSQEIHDHAVALREAIAAADRWSATMTELARRPASALPSPRPGPYGRNEA